VEREANLVEMLRARFRWCSAAEYADVSGWWADPDVLKRLGPALAELHRHEEPSLVAGVEATGFLLGPLVATALGVGFVEIRKARSEAEEDRGAVSRTTPPDYAERDLTLIVQRPLQPRERVVLVDEWIETGANATAAKNLIEDLGCEFVGVAVVVDAADNQTRRELNVRSLITRHRLG
jgi:adenine phosphoribosyltransferase